MYRRRPVVRHAHVGAPHVLSSLLEGRGLLEMALLPASLPLLMEAPQGDGHPVLLVPGFMAGETTLIGLKWMLQNKGYDVHTWGLGRNMGFRSKHANALPQKIRHLHYITGKKVSLVGWSLGGVFSMYGAQNSLDCVRSIITLGSPVSVDAEGSQSPSAVKALYRLVSHRLGAGAHVMQPKVKVMRERRRLAIPTSCLYSLSDGVVPPQEATIDGDPALHENIQVPGSHIGLGFNGIVLSIVADRLAQPENQWKPFAAKGLLARVLSATGAAQPQHAPASSQT
jgi:hypothetical protein